MDEYIGNIQYYTIRNQRKPGDYRFSNSLKLLMRFFLSNMHIYLNNLLVYKYQCGELKEE